MTIDALLSKLDRSNPQDCWLWTGGLDKDGYGKVWIDTKHKRVHRAVYEHLRGPIPTGYHLHHKMELCTSRACANPDHVVPVPPNVHPFLGDTLAARNLTKTHCPKGHPLVEGNLVRRKSRNDRNCLACEMEYRSTPRFKDAQRRRMQKYRSTEKSKAQRREQAKRRRQRQNDAKKGYVTDE